MPSIACSSLLKCVFRANPEYELIDAAHLSAEQADFLRGPADTPEAFAYLSPLVDRGLGVKSISRDVARLFLSLKNPGPLPADAVVPAVDGSGKPSRYLESVAGVVLDNVLQVETGNGFVSGADASDLIYGSSTCQSPNNRIGRLSQAALKYAQSSAIRDVDRLASRIYFFGRLPASPAWTHRFSPGEDILGRLGLRRWALDHGSRGDFSCSHKEGWFFWVSMRNDRENGTRGLTYKLYISPHPEELSQSVPAVTNVLLESPALGFKVADSVFGLLRPDKFVAYFSSRSYLEEATQRLTEQLSGVKAHGVPFTTELAGDGLLSWGIDPPSTETPLAWQERQSWRLWVASRLARHVLAARFARRQLLEPWEFAVRRVEWDGVDPATWTPSGVDWLTLESEHC